jgi:hypothetical protein
MAGVVDMGCMRILLLLLIVSCTKPNPNLCCTDEADCSAARLPVGTGCDDGKVCRGNVCIEQSCATSGDCDLTAPYCVGAPDGSCLEGCTSDAECPGFMQSPESRYCLAGSCTQCRMPTDCPSSAPICSAGACVGCTRHDECGSGICEDNGSCAEESAIAYVNLVGGPTTDCTKASPCSTLERALALQPVRLYIVLHTGRYTRTGPLTIGDPRWIIGNGSPRPVLDRDDDGPVVLAENNADLRIENIELSGGTGDPSNAPVNAGGGLYCRRGGGAPVIKMRDMLVRNNVYTGVRSLNCAFTITRSTFTQNPIGLLLQDSTGTIDRSLFTANGTGASLDSGLYTFTNNFVARNSESGVELFSSNNGNKFEFNTVVDNAQGGTTGAGFNCNLMTPTTFPNNIIARNRIATSGTNNCTYPGSILVDTDITPLKFKQPDTSPYDYHLTAGSLAIDMATISTQDHDFDGDARPKGAGRDVGADEAQ